MADLYFMLYHGEAQAESVLLAPGLARPKGLKNRIFQNKTFFILTHSSFSFILTLKREGKVFEESQAR